jgi:hypothetical protein
VQHTPQPFGIPGRVHRDLKNKEPQRLQGLLEGLQDLDRHGIQGFLLSSSPHHGISTETSSLTRRIVPHLLMTLFFIVPRDT